ncbi:hypothetical protein DFH06DRAFT_1358277 [Mycena polygramma]|nr:hypothetical protein DFH06DRAFT_1358277 [Mycena polygramma]
MHEPTGTKPLPLDSDHIVLKFELLSIAMSGIQFSPSHCQLKELIIKCSDTGKSHLRSHRRTAVIGLLGPLRCMSKGGLRGPIRQADCATISGGVNRQRQRCSNIESASQELSIKYQVIERLYLEQILCSKAVGKRLHDKFNRQEPPQLGLTETANERQRTRRGVGVEECKTVDMVPKTWWPARGQESTPHGGLTSGYKALWRAESCILNSCRFGCLIDFLGAGGCIRRGRREGYKEVSSRSDKLNVGEGGKEEKDSINEECSESCLVLGLQPTSTRRPETSTAPSRRWLRNGHNCQIVELEEFGAPLILCGSLVARQALFSAETLSYSSFDPADGGGWRMRRTTRHTIRRVTNVTNYGASRQISTNQEANKPGSNPFFLSWTCSLNASRYSGNEPNIFQVHLLRSVVNPALEFKKLNLASEQPYRAWREHTAIEDYQRQRVRT